MKIFFILILFIYNIANVNANNYDNSATEYKIKGSFDFKAISIKNNGSTTQKKVSSTRGDIAFSSSANIYLIAQKELEDQFKYGAQMAIATTELNNRSIASHIYALSDYGKIELGSDKSANHKMKITAYNVACGSGNGWDSFVTLSTNASNAAYISNFGNFLDGKTRNSQHAEYARKITYFTPKIYGFQVGVSYIPDSTNHGYNADLPDGSYSSPIKSTKHKFAIKDSFAFGISYESTLLQSDTKLKMSLVGENGKTRILKKNCNDKFSNLKTYTLGSELEYKNYSIAASYSNYMKSLTAPMDFQNNTSIYSIGSRAKYDKFATSITYLFSNNKGYKLNSTALGLEYKFTRGVTHHADVAFYDAKKTLRGTIFIIGSKIDF